MVSVLAIGGTLGWVVHLSRLAQVHHEAVAAIGKVRGKAYYEWGYKPGRSTYYWQGEPSAPKWLVACVGVDCLVHVVAVSHGGWVSHSGMFSDEDMVHVGRLTGLVDLWLLESSVSDAGMANLKGLTNLERLSLHGSHVTAAGLVHLKELRRLRELCLRVPKKTTMANLTGNWTPAGLPGW